MNLARLVPLVTAPLVVALFSGNARAWDGDGGSTGTSSHSNDGYVLTVSAVRKIAAATGGSSGGAGGPRYYYDFAPACRGNAPGDNGALCGPALRLCRARDKTALLYLIFRGTQPEALGNVGTACLGNADFVDRAALDRDVIAQLMRRLPLGPPRVESAPQDATLVHLPTVLWAVDPRTGQPDESTHAVSATVDGVSVTLTVRGTWTWRLGDGSAARTLDSPGTPFVSGVTPDPRVDSAYYTTHDGHPGTGVVMTYDARGMYPVSVTVRWTPSYVVDYEVGTRDLDRAAVDYTTQRALRVGEARAVLVAGG